MRTGGNTATSLEPGYWELMAHAVEPAGVRTLAFAGVIAQGLEADRRPLIAGLDEAGFGRLMELHFPGLALANGTEAGAGGADEYAELLALLMEFRAEPSETLAWLCRAVATAAMQHNHLWQDMGLPGRQTLSLLMRENFPALAARNVGDMKWKKFFYRQLCERAGVPVCKAPHCAACGDRAACFGPEEG
jgi:nitrogen fixation protein NifQ